MKIYKRDDGFEVNDLKDRSIEWVTETYGGNFVEVAPPPLPTEDENREKAIDAELAEIARIESLLSRKAALLSEKAEMESMKDTIELDAK